MNRAKNLLLVQSSIVNGEVEGLMGASPVFEVKFCIQVEADIWLKPGVVVLGIYCNHLAVQKILVQRFGERSASGSEECAPEVPFADTVACYGIELHQSFVVGWPGFAIEGTQASASR